MCLDGLVVGRGRYTVCAVEGLGYLHRLGLTHGNLRPSNMLVLAVRFVCERGPRILGLCARVCPCWLTHGSLRRSSRSVTGSRQV